MCGEWSFTEVSIDFSVNDNMYLLWLKQTLCNVDFINFLIERTESQEAQGGHESVEVTLLRILIGSIK